MRDRTRPSLERQTETGEGRHWPRITVVTPSYNQAAFLAETIDSVLSQGYPNLEYFVIDGGSTDGSIEILRRHDRHLAGWVSERDRGQAHAINKGFARATGEIHTYINSDDLLEPGSLAALGEAFRGGDTWVTSTIRSIRAGCPDGQELAREEVAPSDWLMRNLIPQPGTAWAAALTQHLGGFREGLHFAFDYEFWLRLRFVARLRPRILPRGLAVFRYHDSSKTVSQPARFDAELIPVRAEYRKYLDRPQRLRAWLWERRDLADKRQLRGLCNAAQRRRSDALLDAVASAVYWPPIVFERRTAGLLRRALMPERL